MTKTLNYHGRSVNVDFAIQNKTAKMVIYLKSTQVSPYSFS